MTSDQQNISSESWWALEIKVETTDNIVGD